MSHMRRFYCRRVCFMHPRRFVSRRFITENGGYFGRVPYPVRFGALIQKPKILLNTMEDALGIVILVILLFIILVILGKSIKVVHQGTFMIVERFGQYDVARLY